MNWRELKDKNINVIGGAVSGGLDSCTVTHWLRGKGSRYTAIRWTLDSPMRRAWMPSRSA